MFFISVTKNPPDTFTALSEYKILKELNIDKSNELFDLLIKTSLKLSIYHIIKYISKKEGENEN